MALPFSTHHFTDGFAPSWVRETTNNGMKESFSPSAFSKAFGEGSAKAGLAVGALALIGAGTLAYKGVKNQALNHKFTQALSKVVATNPIVSAADPSRVASYASTIYKFAPHIATDPNLLGAILANAVHGEGIDPMTIKTLIEMEAKYSDTNSSSFISPVKLGP